MAAGSTYTPISSTTLTSNTTTLTLSSIPSTYTDIILICSMRGTINGVYPAMYFNSSTASDYSQTSVYGISTATVGSQRYSANTSIEILDPNRAMSYDSNTFATSIVQLNNYANTSVYKTALIRGNSINPSTSGSNATALVGLWRSTAAINSITIFSEGGGSFYIASGSTFTLYGITAA